MTAERDALKRQYGKLFAAISEVLFEADPVGINFEINPDEYEPEAGTIIPRLSSAQSAEARPMSTSAARKSRRQQAQAKCRLAYIRHLKTERHSSASALAQAQYHRSKAKLLEMKIARQEQETMSVADHNALIDAAHRRGPHRAVRPAGR